MTSNEEKRLIDLARKRLKELEKMLNKGETSFKVYVEWQHLNGFMAVKKNESN